MGIDDRYDRADFVRRRSGGGDWRGEGGFKRALRRIFIEGDDFYSWSLPLVTLPRGVPGIGAIAVRVHLLYIVFIVVQLIWPLQRDVMGFAFAAFAMGTLFALVLLHEFGHCLACRLVGGEADRVLMWPLGGLAFCHPPHRWKAALVTTLGGPMVNVVLMPVLGGAMLLWGAGWGAVVFNPFNPVGVLTTEPWFAQDTSYARYLLWSAYYMNLTLLGFNMLLPMFPMDAGRVLQELLWWRLGYRKATKIAVNIGLVLAMAVGMFALMSGANMLFAVAVFAGITCFNERRKISMMTQSDAEDEPWRASLGPEPDLRSGRPRPGFISPGRAAEAESPDDAKHRAAAKLQQKQRADQAEVDRILEKIARTGMGSLTRKERDTLQSATEKQRAGG